jgi:REP element-mobilizing transposase RayT
MQVNDYRLEDLRFAYSYHAYLRWCMHRRKQYPQLSNLDKTALQELALPFGIHVLACDCRPTECRALVSLGPSDSVAAGASKLKGQVSKWLRQRLGLQVPQTLLARGYFACTSGGTNQERVETYLDAQGDHHGYSERIVAPIFVKTYEPNEHSQAWWHAEHACTHLQFHVVLATAGRHGIFGADEGIAVAEHWAAIQREQRFALRKVSFVPDHVHLAVLLHPAVAPAALVAVLMNESQRLLADRFARELVRVGLGRVWQASAYVGSYGDLATPQVQAYIRRWQASE